MIFYVICEYHNGILNSIRGPYNDQDAAYDHLDLCLAYRKAHPVPITVTFAVMATYPPEYVG